MTKDRKGFAALPPERLRDIASEGGRLAHERGNSRQWSPEQATAAGSKGGQATSQDRERMRRIGKLGGERAGERRRQRREAEFPYDLKAFCQAVTRYREELGFTMAALAKLARVPLVKLRNIEAGQTECLTRHRREKLMRAIRQARAGQAVEAAAASGATVEPCPLTGNSRQKENAP